MPSQPDVTSCGVYCLTAIQALMEGASMPPSVTNIADTRRQFAATLRSRSGNIIPLVPLASPTQTLKSEAPDTTMGTGKKRLLHSDDNYERESPCEPPPIKIRKTSNADGSENQEREKVAHHRILHSSAMPIRACWDALEFASACSFIAVMRSTAASARSILSSIL